MAEVTVTQFAEVLKVPVERLLAQLDEAGIQVGGADDIISDEAKMELLTHLRRAHGRQGEDAAAPRKITLQRKSQQEIKLASHAGPCPHGHRRGAPQEDLPEPRRARGRTAPAAGRARQGAHGGRNRAPWSRSGVEAERRAAEQRERDRLEAESRRQADEEARARAEADARAAGRAAGA